jgi:tetratricopeptide (TPR) repeat protein
MFSNSTPQTPIVGSIAYWSLIVLAIILPIGVYVSASVPPVMTKIFIGGVMVFITAFLVALAILRQQVVSVPRLAIMGVVWTLPLAYFVSMLFSAKGAMSLFGERLMMDSVLFMVVLAFAFTITVLLLTSQKRMLGVYLAMLGSAILLTILQAVLFFAPEWVAEKEMVFASVSLLGSLNDLGVFFGLILIFVLLSLLLLPVTLVVRAVLWTTLLASLFFLAAVNLTVLWWILGAFALACAVYTVYLGFTLSDAHSGKGISYEAIVVVLVAAFFVFASPDATSTLAEKLRIGELDVRPSWQTTVNVGTQGLREQPLLGTGPGSFVYLWAQHMPPEINRSAFWQVDFAYGIGLIPTSIISTGLLGALAWLFFLGLFFLYGVRSFLRARGGERGDITQYLRITSFVGALYLWAIAILQVPSPALVLYAAILTGVFVASLGIGNDGVRQARLVFSENPRMGFLVALVLMGTILFAAFGAYGLTNRFTAEAAYQKGNVLLNRGDIEDGWEHLERAVQRHPTDTYYQLMSIVDIVRIRDIIAQDLPPEDVRDEVGGLLSRSIIHANTATELDPRDYQNWVNLGTIYQNIIPLGIEGTLDSAITAYDRALTLRPSSPRVYLSKATLERSRGNSDVALELVNRAIELRGQYTDAIFLKAQIQLERDDVENAIASVEAITVFEPGNPVAFFQLGLLHYGSNDFGRAAQALERAILINDQYANARYFLGLSYWRLGNIEGAISEFERVRVTNPDNEEVVAIIANLSAGLDPFDSPTPADDIAARDGLPIEASDPNREDAVQRLDSRNLAE